MAIKKISSLSLLLCILAQLIFLSSYAQDTSSIRIIHRGEELKPVGTLLIGIGKLMKPFDKRTDYLFGKGIQTDEKTFVALRKYILDCKSLTRDPKMLKEDNEFYEFAGSDGMDLFLGEKKVKVFFQGLRVLLIRKKLDSKVIEAIKNY